jgi:hypothetical protein
MKQQKNSQIRLDEYNSISLWQMMPSGDGLALKKLKAIVNSVLNGQTIRETNKPFSLLITGEAGKRTHAHAFLRALGIEHINHISAHLLQSTNDIIEYFCNNSPDTGYIISNLQLLPTGVHKKIYQVLAEGQYRSLNTFKMKLEDTPVFGTIVCTAREEKLLPTEFNDSFEFNCELMGHTQQQKELIALQRLKYANVEIENEDVLRTLMLFSPNNLYGLIRLIQLSMVVMMSDSRNVLTSRDVQKGKELW